MRENQAAVFIANDIFYIIYLSTKEKTNNTFTIQILKVEIFCFFNKNKLNFQISTKKQSNSTAINSTKKQLSNLSIIFDNT